MSIFQELHERMNFFAENIATEISEKRYYEIAEIKAIAKTRLWLAICDCLKIQITNKESKRRELIALYAKDGLSNLKKVEISAQISKINAEIKDSKRLQSTMRNHDEYQKLKIYISERYGKELLNDFYQKYCNENDC